MNCRYLLPGTSIFKHLFLGVNHILITHCKKKDKKTSIINLDNKSIVLPTVSIIMKIHL